MKCAQQHSLPMKSALRECGFMKSALHGERFFELCSLSRVFLCKAHLIKSAFVKSALFESALMKSDLYEERSLEMRSS